jgi:hypothetical protein
MNRIASFALLLVLAAVGGSALTMHAIAAQNFPPTAYVNRLPILGSNGEVAGTISIVNGALVVSGANGAELYRSPAPETPQSLPPLQPPLLGDQKTDAAEEIRALRADIDTLATSITALTERVNQLSQQ